jgi:hypothetical protein
MLERRSEGFWLNCPRPLLPRIFEGAHEGLEAFGDYYILISYFVLFATFVVKMSVPISVAALPRCALRGK